MSVIRHKIDCCEEFWAKQTTMKPNNPEKVPLELLDPHNEGWRFTFEGEDLSKLEDLQSFSHLGDPSDSRGVWFMVVRDIVNPSRNSWTYRTRKPLHSYPGLESLLKEYGKGDVEYDAIRTLERIWANRYKDEYCRIRKEPDYNSKEHRLAMAEEILFGERKMEVFRNIPFGPMIWEQTHRRKAMEWLYDGGFVRVRQEVPA